MQVVDGEVQIYARPASSPSHTYCSDESVDSEDEDSGYKLLTEVRNGAPMSSLFTILSLFTEEIDVNIQSERERRPSSSMYSPPVRPMFEESVSMRSDSLTASPSLLPIPNIPPLSEKLTSPTFTESSNSDKQHRTRMPLIDPAGIIARASVDSTIAIIPAEAFRRLTQKYPKSAAHIVQVILARFQRVTFQTGNNYLGLTSEILKTEIAFNELLRYSLPSHIGSDAIEQIRNHFNSPQEKHQQALTSKRRTSDSSPAPSSINSLRAERPKSSQHRPNIQHIPEDQEVIEGEIASHDRVMAGDLASNAPVPQRHGSVHASAMLYPRRPSLRLQLSTKSLKSGYGNLDFSDLGDDEDLLSDSESQATIILEDEYEQTIRKMKGAVLECILEALGVTKFSLEAKSPAPVSVENSPRLSAFESKRSAGRRQSLHSTRAGVPTGLGSLGLGSSSHVYLDDDSVASSNIHQYNPPATFTSIKQDLCADVEIYHYKAGARLVKQGDPNRGLYYVIDGFLDVCTREKSGQFKTIYTVKPGGIGGYLGAMSGYNSFVDIRATTDVFIGFLPNKSLERLIERQSIVMLTMAKRLTSVISSLILHLDFALEWVQIGAGEVLYRQGDEADSIFIVLNGRLRALKTNESDEVELFDEYGKGESIGELEVLSKFYFIVFRYQEL